MKRIINVIVSGLLFLLFIFIFALPMVIALIKSFLFPGKNVLIVNFFGERKWITVINKIVVDERMFVTFDEDGLVYLMELKYKEGELYLIDVEKERAKEVLTKLGYSVIKEIEVPEGGI